MIKWTLQDEMEFVLYVARVTYKTNPFVSKNSVWTKPTSLNTK